MPLARDGGRGGGGDNFSLGFEHCGHTITVLLSAGRQPEHIDQAGSMHQDVEEEGRVGITLILAPNAMRGLLPQKAES